MLPQKGGETWSEGERHTFLFTTLLGDLVPAHIQKMCSPGPGPAQMPVRYLWSKGMVSEPLMVRNLSDTLDSHSLVNSTLFFGSHNGLPNPISLCISYYALHPLFWK